MLSGNDRHSYYYYYYYYYFPLVTTQAHCGDPGQGGTVSVGPIWHACIAIHPTKHWLLLLFLLLLLQLWLVWLEETPSNPPAVGHKPLPTVSNLSCVAPYLPIGDPLSLLFHQSIWWQDVLSYVFDHMGSNQLLSCSIFCSFSCQMPCIFELKFFSSVSYVLCSSDISNFFCTDLVDFPQLNGNP